MKSVVEEIQAQKAVQVMIKAAKGTTRRRIEEKFRLRVDRELRIWFRKVIAQLRREGFEDELESRRIIFFQSKRQGLKSMKALRQESERIVESVFREFLVEKPSTDRIRGLIGSINREAFDFGIQTGFESLGVKQKAIVPEDSISFELTNEEIITALEVRRAEMAGRVTDTILNDSQEIIRKQVFENERSVFDVMRELEVRGITPARSFRLVQTEVQAGIGTARHEMFVRSGVQRKRWITVGDNRVRPAHTENEDAEWIPIDKPYPNGAQHPGDGPSAINCRCVEEPDLSDPNLLIQPWEGGAIPPSVPVPLSPEDSPLSPDVGRKPPPARVPDDLKRGER